VGAGLDLDLPCALRRGWGADDADGCLPPECHPRGRRCAERFESLQPQAPPPAPEADPVQLRSLLDAWNPLTGAVMGLGAFVIILWLMMFKPF
jgi:hypothetical protein